MTFTLDTSGEVCIPLSPPVSWCPDAKNVYLWDRDISPFTQGYVEALFADLAHRVDEEADRERITLGGPQDWRFSDLAPETLARIIADCEGARDGYRAANTKACGASFWAGRNDPAGCWRYLVTDGFPPLTVRLGDDGKVHLS